MQDWSKEVLEANINNDLNGLFYLYTTMCGTCQMAGRMLDVTAELMPDVQMGKANLNYMPEIAEQWEIESVPCLIMFKEGKPLKKIYAFRSVPYLIEQIQTKILS